VAGYLAAGAVQLRALTGANTVPVAHAALATAAGHWTLTAAAVTGAVAVALACTGRSRQGAGPGAGQRTDKEPEPANKPDKEPDNKPDIERDEEPDLAPGRKCRGRRAGPRGGCHARSRVSWRL
jgi:hypothetical protein